MPLNKCKHCGNQTNGWINECDVCHVDTTLYKLEMIREERAKKSYDGTIQPFCSCRE